MRANGRKKALTTDRDLGHQIWSALLSFGPSLGLDSSVFSLPCARGAQARRLILRDEFVKEGGGERVLTFLEEEQTRDLNTEIDDTR